MIPDVLSMLDVFCPACRNKPAGHCRPEGGTDPELCYWCIVAKRQRETQRAAAKRRRANPRALAGVDVDACVADLRRVPVLAELLGKKPVKVSVGHRAEARWSGHAKRYGRAIRVAGGPDIRPEEVIEIVLHELCHLATPKHGHDERYRRVLRRAALEAWGIEVPIDPKPSDAERGVIAYAMDRIIMSELRRLLIQWPGTIRTYPPEPKKPKPSVDVVEKRAAHAAAMLAKAERKLKLARTVHKRWAAKVRYYERAAAKRGGT